MIGETVIAVGNPFGLSNTVTTGIVSAVQRTVQGETGRTYTDFIQTDAAINPGNSGGALANVLGELIGINTAIVGGANTIGFAIPVERVRRIADELLRFGEVKPVWIGPPRSDRSRTTTARRRAARGFASAPSSRAPPPRRPGSSPGDVVVASTAGPSTRGRTSTRLITAVGPGKSVALEVRRDGRDRTVLADDVARAEGPRPDGPPARDRPLRPRGPERRRRHVGRAAVARRPEGASSAATASSA